MYWLLFRLIPVRLIVLAAIAVGLALVAQSQGVPVVDAVLDLLGVNEFDLTGRLA